MTKQEALRALRNALVTLYNNPTSIHRLVDDAGMDAGLVNFQGAALEIWYSVLTEAESQGKIESLVSAVDKPYQANKALQQAYQAYKQASGVDSFSAAQSSATADSSKPNVTINTGGGSYIAGNVNTGGGDFVGRDQKK
jgi:hypothetical protein